MGSHCGAIESEHGQFKREKQTDHRFVAMIPQEIATLTTDLDTAYLFDMGSGEKDSRNKVSGNQLAASLDWIDLIH